MSYQQPQQYQQPPGPVDKTVTGMLTGFEPRSSGWTRFSIQEQGRQYPYKCDTKKPELVQQAHALMGQVVTVQVREETSTTLNPHNGQPYTNRYLNAIAPAGQMQAQPQQAGYPQQMQPVSSPAPVPQYQPQPQQAPQPQQPVDPYRPDARDLKIYRQVAWKGAIELVTSGKIELDPKAMVAAAEIGMAYLVFGPTRFGVQAFDQPQQPQPQQLAGDPVVGTPYNGQQPEEATAGVNVNTAESPCPGCGAVPGQVHADDCIPF